MRLPVRLTPQHPLRKIFAAVLIAAGATALGTGAHYVPGLKVAMAGLDNTLYDAFYKFRKPEDRTGGPIVILDEDDETLRVLDKKNVPWPVPRNQWANTIAYLEKAGARAIVFDKTFQERRAYDTEFGAAIDKASIPIIMGTIINPDGKPAAFAPLVKTPPTFGAVNVIEERTVRNYIASVHDVPSLALRAVQSIAAQVPQWGTEPFRLHYFGPFQWPNGQHTYRYVPAWGVFVAYQQPARAKEVGADPAIFRGKIVLIGATAAAEFDLKSSPLANLYPGVEAQATAIDDLLSGQRVIPIAFAVSTIIAFFGSLAAGLGVVLPKRATLKTAAAIIAAAALVALAIVWFDGQSIRWLPLASPLIALLIAIIGAFVFSYVTEDRQRRMLLKALSQYLSPHVAAEIANDFGSMKLGGQRREMTVMFSDIAGFTSISETMDSEKLSTMLNFYLGEMSGLIWDQNGTLDKYIGDAIMCFWNAPAQQPDHAALACRAALAMRDREAQIQDQLRDLGAPGMMTRIGINSGPMVFGNMGSPQKFNYTVLGDSVNLGSRLEGANKLYGSRILVAESTAALVKERFVVRELDYLQVKGKQKPLAVYELIAEGAADEQTGLRVKRYEEALKLYRGQKWNDAEKILGDLHLQFPHDEPVTSLLKRIAKLRREPLPADWDGVYVAKDK
jgi:class 3 adenylate cyclase/CHASE2 domain-containing sensor protein